MAAVPAVAPGAATDDDIASLLSSLGLADFPYVDMRALTDLQALLDRWPLLADMHASDSLETPACPA